MLVLSRKIGEKVMIGDNIDITITGVKGERVRIGIEAPPDVRVVRGELAQAPAPTPSQPRAKVYRILIVEDDQIDRELIRRCLPSSERLALFESSFGEEGLDRCRKEKPDCVILDFRLPDIDGLEFLQRMNRAERAGIPVIVVTGQASEQIGPQMLRQGAQAFLTKRDISPQNLWSAIVEALHISPN